MYTFPTEATAGIFRANIGDTLNTGAKALMPAVDVGFHHYVNHQGQRQNKVLYFVKYIFLLFLYSKKYSQNNGKAFRTA